MINKNFLVISFFSLFSINQVMADYMAIFPLEVSNNGSLPNNSIIFSNTITPPTIIDCDNPNPEDVVECNSRLNAWEQFAIDNSLDNNWSNLDWNGIPLSILPTEEYPLNNISGSIDFCNNNLTDISAFSSIQSMSGDLYLCSNQLTNLNGLNNLSIVNGYLDFYNNNLIDISALSNLQQVGQEFYLNHNNLTNLNGLNNLQSVNGQFDLSYNQLTSLSALSSLQSVSGYFHVANNNLTNLNGLENLSFVGYALDFSNNNLQNVNALINLQSVSGSLFLQGNQLTDISGLANLIVSGNISIDLNYNGAKLAANTRFCMNNNSFVNGLAQKTQLCE